MRAPQIIMIILCTISLTIDLLKHGESKGEYNFWVSLMGAAIEIAILKWGGFF